MSDPMPTSETITWAVGRQVGTTGPLGDGTYGPGVSVPVKLSTGETLTLFIPTAQYRDVATVKALIMDAVAHHLTVSGLSGKA